MICQRCGKEVSSLKMSFFNEDECCHECLEIEKEHPDYAEAKRIELEECKKKNYNYPGIGLPGDFSRFLKARSSSIGFPEALPEVDADYIDLDPKEVIKEIQGREDDK